MGIARVCAGQGQGSVHAPVCFGVYIEGWVEVEDEAETRHTYAQGEARDKFFSRCIDFHCGESASAGASRDTKETTAVAASVSGTA